MEEFDFKFMQQFLLSSSGLVLTEDKRYLLDTRLQPVVRKRGLGSVKDVVANIRRSQTGDMAKEVIDAMTTNETLFFRDQYPYEALKTLILPELHMTNGMRAPIKIWSAAASRGQEAVSLAITAMEGMANAEKYVRIYGTDLSKEALDYAKDGIYTQLEAQRGMPIKQLVRFFEQDGTCWKVSDELKALMTFEPGNLISDSIVMQARRHGPFNVVFLRNVLIYFSVDERKRVIDRVSKTMARGGYLITGAAELVEGVHSRWESVMFQGKRLWKLVG